VYENIDQTLVYARAETINKLLKDAKIDIEAEYIARDTCVDIYLRVKGKLPKLIFSKFSWEKAGDYLAGFLAGIVETVRELREELEHV